MNHLYEKVASSYVPCYLSEYQSTKCLALPRGKTIHQIKSSFHNNTFYALYRIVFQYTAHGFAVSRGHPSLALWISPQCLLYSLVQSTYFIYIIHLSKLYVWCRIYKIYSRGKDEIGKWGQRAGYGSWVMEAILTWAWVLNGMMIHLSKSSSNLFSRTPTLGWKSWLRFQRVSALHGLCTC